MKGLICMWAGEIADIPTGWKLCDGENGRPDLRNKFIIGAGDTHAPGATGGEDSHNHDITAQVTGGPSATTNCTAGSAPVGSQTHTHSLTGETAAKETLPPYYALCFIIKL